MTTSPAQILQTLLADPRDLANVKSVTTADVTYGCLNENPDASPAWISPRRSRSSRRSRTERSASSSFSRTRLDLREHWVVPEPDHCPSTAHRN